MDFALRAFGALVEPGADDLGMRLFCRWRGSRGNLSERETSMCPHAHTFFLCLAMV
jgi:hypothetical protein